MLSVANATLMAVVLWAVDILVVEVVVFAVLVAVMVNVVVVVIVMAFLVVVGVVIYDVVKANETDLALFMHRYFGFIACMMIGCCGGGSIPSTGLHQQSA